MPELDAQAGVRMLEFASELIVEKFDPDSMSEPKCSATRWVTTDGEVVRVVLRVEWTREEGK